MFGTASLRSACEPCASCLPAGRRTVLAKHSNHLQKWATISDDPFSKYSPKRTIFATFWLSLGIGV